MALKFNRRIARLDDEDDYFASLPQTCMQSANEFDSFANFVLSDLLVEIVRFLKVKVLISHL
jgi:hypothetical protein